MFKKVLLIFLSLNLVNCSSTKKLEQSAAENKCEEAMEQMPDNQTGYQLVAKTKQASGTVLSYSATGAAYAVQVLWNGLAGITLVAVGAPALYGLAYSPVALLSKHELKNITENMWAPPLGKNTAHNTENWSCPNVDVISQSIRKVSKCYADRGGEENRTKALTSLQSVEKSGRFYRCLSPVERKAFIKDLVALKSPSS